MILGKTNLSEWANIRSGHSLSGWSAVGGLVRNPYALDRSAGGSSSGTGSAIAASLAAAGVGTETDGSVTCPVVVRRPGRAEADASAWSRAPTSCRSRTSQDTPGPMARSVADAAILLTAMAGSDPADPATAEADARRADYLAALDGASLAGKRLGVLTYCARLAPSVDAVFDAALATLRAAGAEVVEIEGFEPPSGFGKDEMTVLLTELKAGLNAYLATTPPQVTCRTLADVIAFNRGRRRASSACSARSCSSRPRPPPGSPIRPT